MRDIVGLVASAGLIFLVLSLATLLIHKGIISRSLSRKLVHIGVSHWWLIYLVLIDSPWVGLGGSLAFILINAFSHRRRIFIAMEEDGPRRSLGTIWFPFSLALLILLSAAGVLTRWEAGVGALIMGWGDGMAAVVGQRWGKNPTRVFGQTKSLQGSLALIVFSSVVVVAMSLVFDPGIGLRALVFRTAATALFAALVELCTPLGLDNLSLPLLCALFFHYVARGSGAEVFVYALVLNGLIALGAYRLRAVDPSGAIVGTGLGTAILSFGGFPALILLAGFFLSSTLLGRISGRLRAPSGIEEKGGRRDGYQVLANIGTSGLAAFLYHSTGNPAWLAALVGGFAAANADTWASEIGVLSRRPPRSILTWKEVPAGASGGVSLLGFFASALGAGFIGVLFLLAYGWILQGSVSLVALAMLAAAGGFFGALVDSLFGASLQGKYLSALSGQYTEKPRADGRANLLVGGWAWVNNDVVNLASTGIAALVTAGVYSSLF